MTNYSKKASFRRVWYHNMTSVKNHRKAICLCERAEDTECITYVKKNFIYVLTPKNQDIQTDLPEPDIVIKKAYNSKTKEEKFYFRVKGFFYITKELSVLKVHFCHSLQIKICWKSKIFSPKPVSLS